MKRLNKKGRPEKRTTEIFSAEGKSGGRWRKGLVVLLSSLQDITGKLQCMREGRPT
jgi:hypothetical protein